MGSGSSRTRTRSSPAKMSAVKGEPIARRDFISKTLGASALFAATAANADIDYAGVGYLGGAAQIDVNNANVRVYTKKPGMYPTIATKIVSNVPYKNKDDMYAKAKFTEKEAETVKQYDSQFIFFGAACRVRHRHHQQWFVPLSAAEDQVLPTCAD